MDHNRRCQRNYIAVIPFFFVATLLLAIAGCYRYITFPVSTEEIGLSPPYILVITNDTAEQIRIRPNSTGQAKGYQARPIARGQSSEFAFQIVQLKVGSDDVTPTRHAVSTPYIESTGPNMARIFVEHGNAFNKEYLLDIGLRNKDWFRNWESDKPEPKRLPVKISDFNETLWFTGGPERP